MDVRTRSSWGILYYVIVIVRNITLYITLQYNTIQYNTIHYITIHYIIIHYITLHYRLQFCNEMLLASQTLYSRTDEKDDTLEDLTETCGYFLKPFKIGNNIFQII